MQSAVRFFQDGGIFLYPLVIIFVVGVAIAIERWIYLTKETIKNRNLWDDVAPHLGAGNFKQAVALANNSTAQIGTVLKYGLARLSTARRRDDIQHAMEESLLEIVPRLEKRTHYLSSLANIGMLVGLLGTIIATNMPMLADRKSTRLNSSHVEISYAVFCLKKKKTNTLLQLP